jgi:hypothetical protein
VWPVWRQSVIAACNKENDCMALQKINLQEKLASFDETWVPKIVAELNGQYVKVVKKM